MSAVNNESAFSILEINAFTNDIVYKKIIDITTAICVLPNRVPYQMGKKNSPRTQKMC